MIFSARAGQAIGMRLEGQLQTIGIFVRWMSGIFLTF